ncbi:alanine racemase, partial [Klebsiella pneumoniae]|uniref:alanine racemase n=1 Tax=Klebsiella pneumoniae TaxID=573 RepID=UPI0021750D28
IRDSPRSQAQRLFQAGDAKGVGRLEEALRLRAGGIAQPILLLEGFFAAEDLAALEQADPPLLLYTSDAAADLTRLDRSGRPSTDTT